MNSIAKSKSSPVQATTSLALRYMEPIHNSCWLLLRLVLLVNANSVDPEAAISFISQIAKGAFEV